MYILTFMTFNREIRSYTIEAKDMAQALEVAKMLSAGQPVTLVEV